MTFDYERSDANFILRAEQSCVFEATGDKPNGLDWLTLADWLASPDFHRLHRSKYGPRFVQLVPWMCTEIVQHEDERDRSMRDDEVLGLRSGFQSRPRHLRGGR